MEKFFSARGTDNGLAFFRAGDIAAFFNSGDLVAITHKAQNTILSLEGEAGFLPAFLKTQQWDNPDTKLVQHSYTLEKQLTDWLVSDLTGKSA